MKPSLIILFVIIFLLLCFLYSLPGYGLKDIVKLPLTIPFLQETNCLDEYFDSIVCICLPERKNHMKKVFDKWNIKKVTFFDAFLRTNFNHDDFIKKKFITPNYHEKLNLGRICCHYSAMHVYDEFVNSNHESILIFEDDININTYTSVKHMNLVLEPVIKNIPHDWEYLNFSKCHDYCLQASLINNKYWTIPKRPLCRSAIALRKNAAKIIIRDAIPMHNQPGDKMIAELINQKKFNAYATKNLFFFQHREKFGSTLQNVHKTNPPKCSFGK